MLTFLQTRSGRRSIFIWYCCSRVILNVYLKQHIFIFVDSVRFFRFFIFIDLVHFRRFFYNAHFVSPNYYVRCIDYVCASIYKRRLLPRHANSNTMH